MSGKATDDETGVVVRSLRISAELDEQVGAAARTLGLRKSDVQRLALERGVELLLRQLGKDLPRECA